MTLNSLYTCTDIFSSYSIVWVGLGGYNGKPGAIWILLMIFCLKSSWMLDISHYGLERKTVLSSYGSWGTSGYLGYSFTVFYLAVRSWADLSLMACCAAPLSSWLSESIFSVLNFFLDECLSSKGTVIFWSTIDLVFLCLTR